MRSHSPLQFISNKNHTRQKKSSCTICPNSSNNSVNTTVNYFKKTNISQNSIFNILREYKQNSNKNGHVLERISDMCVHRNNEAVRQTTYLEERFDKRLLSFNSLFKSFELYSNKKCMKIIEIYWLKRSKRMEKNLIKRCCKL